jgi:hypothetical protein
MPNIAYLKFMDEFGEIGSQYVLRKLATCGIFTECLCSRSSVDRASASEAVCAGSIPVGNIFSNSASQRLPDALQMSESLCVVV